MTRKSWAKHWLRIRNSLQRAYAGEGVHAEDDGRPPMRDPSQRPPAYCEAAMRMRRDIARKLATS